MAMAPARQSEINQTSRDSLFELGIYLTPPFFMYFMVTLKKAENIHQNSLTENKNSKVMGPI
mgnify:CR=1 FL=1